MTSLHYILKDHLGSWTVIADEDGRLEQELSYDAWGNLRDPGTWCVDATIRPMFDRGYTGHEHHVGLGLINMNGRMYDPVMSSFLSVDRYVQNPGNSQGFNLYAYCMYNPLKYTDPSGWTMIGGNKPRNPFHDDWSVSHVAPVFEPSDFTNAYHLVNQALYGDGSEFLGGSGYGAYFKAGVEHYKGASPGNIWSVGSLANNYIHNPSTFNRRELLDAGVRDFNYGTWWTSSGMGGYRLSLTYDFGTLNYGNDNYYYGYQGFFDITIGAMNLSKGASNSFLRMLSFSNSVFGTIIGNNANYYNSSQQYKELGAKIRPILKKIGHPLRKSSTRVIGRKAANVIKNTGGVIGFVGVAYTGLDIAFNNDGIIKPSHVVDAGVGIACLAVGPPGWIIGASYIAVDIFSFAFSGQSFGNNLNSWCGGMGFDVKTFSIVQ